MRRTAELITAVTLKFPIQALQQCNNGSNPPLGKIKINVDAAIGELQACCAAVIRNFRSPVNHHGNMQSILSRS
ncbi:hypothetical protein FCV25MIE_19304 [Fagus crenata]